MPVKDEAKMINVDANEYNQKMKELTELHEAYDTLANAFNKLLKEYNEMHVNMLFTK